MARAKLKTKATTCSVDEFLGALDPERRKDCETLVRMLSRVTKAPPKMWGKAIVGFGERRMTYESGRELDWFVAGFSPRKKDLTLYLPGRPLDGDLGKRLGKHSSGKGCLYIRKLSDVDLDVLEEIARHSARSLKEGER